MRVSARDSTQELKKQKAKSNISKSNSQSRIGTSSSRGDERLALSGAALAARPKV
ncbi:hypothetical protein [Rufibacter roseus]|uniref:Uncharacterized protein n=1 Tax=Rufibacter roseus TaxID=1567108 RepID=A0ABW2DQN2_9BACT|nr:hypothetical protein [Rufibacter roseus]